MPRRRSGRADSATVRNKPSPIALLSPRTVVRLDSLQVRRAARVAALALSIHQPALSGRWANEARTSSSCSRVRLPNQKVGPFRVLLDALVEAFLACKLDEFRRRALELSLASLRCIRRSGRATVSARDAPDRAGRAHEGSQARIDGLVERQNIARGHRFRRACDVSIRSAGRSRAAGSIGCHATSAWRAP